MYIAPIVLFFRMSRFTRRTVKLVDGVSVAGSSSAWMFTHAEGELADLAGDPPADLDRHLAAAVEPDAPAVEEERRRRWRVEAAAQPAAAAQVARRAAAGEVEDAAALEEEVALLGEEQVEAGQVHLLLVDLDLREVGVVGEVGDEVGGDAVLHVEADLAVEIVGHRRDAHRSVADRPRAYGLISKVRPAGGLSMPVRLP